MLFGSSITLTSGEPAAAVWLAQVSEEADLDLAVFEDDPRRPDHLATWTALTYALANTEAIGVAANVAEFPVQRPAALAHAATSLDLLSRGRFELALGVGVCRSDVDPVHGGAGLAGYRIEDLEAAVDAIREAWCPVPSGTPPTVKLWLGGHVPPALALVGGKADGWLLALEHPDQHDLDRCNRLIDDACGLAGRTPESVRRMLKIARNFANRGGGTDRWIEQLATLALDRGVSAFVLSTDEPVVLERFGAEVAPAVRELVAQERRRPTVEFARDRVEVGSARSGRLDVRPTLDDGVRRSSVRLWDEGARPVYTGGSEVVSYARGGRMAAQHLIDVHDVLRSELSDLRRVVDQVREGLLDAADARSAISKMTMRQNDWAMGAYCAAYCRHITAHHGLEDQTIFPYLRSREAALAPVVDRLQDEHHVIHGVLDQVDRELVAYMTDPEDLTALDAAVDLLSDTMLSHLAYEEGQLIEPLARFGFYPGQL